MAKVGVFTPEQWARDIHQGLFPPEKPSGEHSLLVTSWNIQTRVPITVLHVSREPRLVAAPVSTALFTPHCLVFPKNPRSVPFQRATRTQLLTQVRGAHSLLSLRLSHGELAPRPGDECCPAVAGLEPCTDQRLSKEADGTPSLGCPVLTHTPCCPRVLSSPVGRREL